MQSCSSETLDLSGSARNCPDIQSRWLDFIARHACSYSLPTPLENTVNTHARSRSSAEFTLVRITSANGRYQLQRDAVQISNDGNDRYALCLSLQGGFEVSQVNRTERIETGSYTLFSTAEPSRISNVSGGSNDVIGLFLPRGFVEGQVRAAQDMCARAFRSAGAMHCLVFESLRAFEKAAWRISDEQFLRSAQSIADLALAAFTGLNDPSSQITAVRAGNLARAKQIIRERLSDPSLRPYEVAKRTGISLSYLHELFRDNGCSVGEFMKAERLHKAHELLRSSSAKDMTVSDVALECGFCSFSHFSTSFKTKFGATPRDVLWANPTPGCGVASAAAIAEFPNG